MDPDKNPGACGGAAEYQKNYYIQKPNKKYKIKNLNIKAVYQRPTCNKLPLRTSRKHRLTNC